MNLRKFDLGSLLVLGSFFVSFLLSLFDNATEGEADKVDLRQNYETFW